MPPAIATAANAMKPATGPVIDCWICCSGDSQGNPPPPLDASDGSINARVNANDSALPIKMFRRSRDMPFLLDLGIGFRFVLETVETLDLDDVTHAPALRSPLDRDDEVDRLSDDLAHRL